MTEAGGMARVRRTGTRLLGAFSGRGRRLYIFPTRHGFGFFLVLAGILTGAANYNNNLAFMMTFLLGALTFAGLFRTHGNLMGLEIPSARAEPVFAGDNAVFDLAVDARDAARPMVSLRLKGGPETTVDLAPGSWGRVPLAVPATTRGLIRIEAVDVWTVYPLGLFRAWTRVPLQAECLVYPAPIPGDLVVEPGDVGEGEGAGVGEGVDDFKELRAYRPGDALNRIAWKQSSRGTALLTKDFQGAVGASDVFDFYGLKTGDTEYKLSRLCAMVLAAAHHDRAYGLNLPGLRIEPGNGRVHRERCLEALARFGWVTAFENGQREQNIGGTVF